MRKGNKMMQKRMASLLMLVGFIVVTNYVQGAISAEEQNMQDRIKRALELLAQEEAMADKPVEATPPVIDKEWKPQRYEKDQKQGTWEELPLNKKFSKVSVGSKDHVWLIADDSSIHQLKDGSLTQKGIGIDIGVGRDGAVFGVNAKNEVYQFANGAWSLMPGVALTDLDIGDKDNVWGILKDGSGTQSFRYKSGKWEPVLDGKGDPVKGIKQYTVNTMGEVIALGESGQIYRYDAERVRAIERTTVIRKEVKKQEKKSRENRKQRLAEKKKSVEEQAKKEGEAEGEQEEKSSVTSVAESKKDGKSKRKTRRTRRTRKKSRISRRGTIDKKKKETPAKTSKIDTGEQAETTSTRERKKTVATKKPRTTKKRSRRTTRRKFDKKRGKERDEEISEEKVAKDDKKEDVQEDDEK